MRTFALVGNPNCGKTTLFNKLTHSQEYVGNWAGVTVEKKQGLLKINDELCSIIDLPGVYSLSSYSQDEIITRDYILYEKPDLIINIIDASNLERNLYLTSQLIDTEIPIIICLNMIDELEKNGVYIDYKNMADFLGIDIVGISASKSLGLDDLLNKLKFFVLDDENIYDRNGDNKKKNKIKTLRNTSFLTGTEEFFLAEKIINELAKNNIFCSLLVALKIIEHDEKFLYSYNMPSDLLDLVEIDNKNKSWDVIIASDRYNFIDGLIKKYVIRENKNSELNLSNSIDKILVNKYLAIPIFLLIMFVIFEFSFNLWGKFFSGVIQNFIDNIFIDSVSCFLGRLNVSLVLIDLITRGVIPGIGMILTFLPQIAILFFFLCFMEDSGYISRAAFIMDKPLRKIGLSGKSFVPMLLGVGCSVPAIMSTRTLDNRKDKFLTVMLIPFISCSGRIPVYAFLANIFFEKHSGLVIFSIYLLGIIVCAISGIILNKSILLGESSNFIMELPPYRIPVFKNLMRNIYIKLKDFVEKAGTVLLLASIVIWFMQNFSFKFNLVSDSSRSILAGIGKFISPFFRPIGFSDWRLCSALLTGFIAKETIISSLSILFMNTKKDLSLILSPLAAYSYMIFLSLYIPCVAAVIVIKRELNSIRWTIFVFLFQIFVAWMVSFFVYRIGKLFFWA